MDDDPRLVVELRSATISEVKYPERIVTVFAVPYESASRPGTVVFRGRQYTEVFARGAFKGVESRNGKVRVNREHRRGDTVGKVETFHDTHEGLIADLKIVKSPAGDEVLALADEDMISPSIGFAIQKGSDQQLDTRSDPPTRYIHRAFVDHMGLVEDPAYGATGVLSVRNLSGEPDEFEGVSTPRLDEWVSYLMSRRAGVTA